MLGTPAAYDNLPEAPGKPGVLLGVGSYARHARSSGETTDPIDEAQRIEERVLVSTADFDAVPTTGDTLRTRGTNEDPLRSEGRLSTRRAERPYLAGDAARTGTPQDAADR